MKEISSNNIVIAHVSWNVSRPKNNKINSQQENSSINLSGIFMHIFVNENGKWLISTSQNKYSNISTHK